MRYFAQTFIEGLLFCLLILNILSSFNLIFDSIFERFRTFFLLLRFLQQSSFSALCGVLACAYALTLAYAHTQSRIRAHVHSEDSRHTYSRMSTRTRAHTLTCVCIHTFPRMHLHMRIHTQKYMHSSTHMHIRA